MYIQAIPFNTFYAYFDLKNATIHILDGYTGPSGQYLVNNAGTNEVETVTINGSPTGGTFRLFFLGFPTAQIAYNASSATVQSALQAIQPINGANVTVSGSAGGPYTVTFTANLGSKPQPLFTSDNAFTGGTTPSVAVTEATPGVYAYATGSTTINVDSGSGLSSVGDTFNIPALDPNVVNDNTVYQVTGVTGSPNMTAITFTPGLTQGVQDDSLVLHLPHDLEVRLGEGNFTFTEKKTREYKKNRGKLDAVRNGDEDPLEVKLDFAWIFIRSNTGEALTVEDVLKQQGRASNWVTAGHDPCEPYCVTMRILYAPPCPGVATEVIDLAEFRYEELQHDTKTGMIACTGKCNLTVPTVTRV